TVVMFDMALCAWLLAVLVILWDHVRAPKAWHILALAACMAGGVLTKGPVMYLYALWPMAMYPFWRDRAGMRHGKFYLGMGLAFIASLLPVLVWICFALKQADSDFAYWLVWNQTAGRISGNFSSSHARPLYFYLPYLLVLLLPWGLLPGFRRGVKAARQDMPAAVKFILSAVVPVVISFSLISGKQIHYLLPFLPLAVLVMFYYARPLSPRTVRRVALGLAALFISGQALASQVFLPRYDLRDIAAFYQQHKDRDWAFARKYQGELGFVARQEKAFESLQYDEVPGWFAKHPHGYAVIRFPEIESVAEYHEIMSRPYRGKYIGIFERKD
ncbi:MAG: hypothetical protein H7831_18480, partial [Magnetococcus sp. WYHC-3]